LVIRSQITRPNLEGRFGLLHRWGLNFPGTGEGLKSFNVGHTGAGHEKRVIKLGIFWGLKGQKG